MAHGGWVAAEENIKIKELKKRKSERRTVRINRVGHLNNAVFVIFSHRAVCWEEN